MMSKKLIFTLKKINGRYLPMTVKCNVLNLRQVAELLSDFLVEINPNLKKEQDKLLKKVQKSKKLCTKCKRLYTKILKLDWVSDEDIKIIEDALK